MRRLLAFSFGLLLASVALRSQGTILIQSWGSSLPTFCGVGEVYIKTGDGLYFCSPNNTWTSVAPVIPTNSILFISSGSCPSGYTELSAASGRMIRATVVASGNVGTTSGADSVTPTFTGGNNSTSTDSAGTPSGTNSTVSFTPSGTNAAISAGTPAGTNGATATTGNCAATNLAIGTGAATACKATAPNLVVTAPTFTGSALGTHSHTFTGSSGTVPAETFTGSALGTHGHTVTPTGTISAVDTRAALYYMIPCKKT
jgi:hypothetical protein